MGEVSRFAKTEPFILQNVNLTIEPGEFVVIVGALRHRQDQPAMIIFGLLDATDGDVVIDDMPLSWLGWQTYRKHVAAVMQDDHLISGSIADNICFFDPAFDMEGMMECPPCRLPPGDRADAG